MNQHETEIWAGIPQVLPLWKAQIRQRPHADAGKAIRRKRSQTRVKVVFL